MQQNRVTTARIEEGMLLLLKLSAGSAHLRIPSFFVVLCLLCHLQLQNAVVKRRKGACQKCCLVYSFVQLSRETTPGARMTEHLWEG